MLRKITSLEPDDLSANDRSFVSPMRESKASLIKGCVF